jgi:hypothetical protein
VTGEVRPPRRAPRKQSHWSRNIWIGIIGVFVVLAAIGSAVNRESLVAEQSAPPDVVASGAVASEPDGFEESSPPAGGTSLVSIEGSGPMTSEPFEASGDTVDVTYEYTCTEDASFTLNFYGVYDSPLLPDVLVSEFAPGGSGTASESLGGSAGPFTVEVDTVCDWTVEVLGTP